MLIVHGLSYFSYDWIDAASQIAHDREVVAIDMRGFGESDWSAARDYKLETLSNDVIAVLDALGWDKAVLMGHSFGGRVCLATAGWKPERAAGLVLVDFAPDIAAPGRRYTAAAHRRPAGCVRLGRRGDDLRSRGSGGCRPARALGSLPETRPTRAMRSSATCTTATISSARWRAGQSAPVPAFLWPMLAETDDPDAGDPRQRVRTCSKPRRWTR